MGKEMIIISERKVVDFSDYDGVVCGKELGRGAAWFVEVYKWSAGKHCYDEIAELSSEKDAKALTRAIGEALAGGARRFDVEEWKTKYTTHGE